MYYIGDYVMRQIHLLTQGFAKTFFHRDDSAIELFDENDDLSLSGVLYHRLKKLLNENKIDEAEELLFDELAINPLPSHFRTAMQFYSELSQMTNARLEAAHFSREEIQKGLEDVARIYGVEPGADEPGEK